MSTDLPQRRPRASSLSGPQFAAAAVRVYAALTRVRVGKSDPLAALAACARLSAATDVGAAAELESATAAIGAGASPRDAALAALGGILRRLEDALVDGYGR